MVYYVYKITNLLNNKVYIGKTKDLKKRWSQHCANQKKNSLIAKAIQKYGFENFKFETLFESKDELLVNEQEFLFIKQENCLVPNGYNLRCEIESKLAIHEISKDKISKTQQGKKNNKKTSSEFIGVVKRCGKNITVYKCAVRINRKIVCRTFYNEIDAAEAYDKLVLYIFGPNAKINFPEKREEYLKLDLKSFYTDFLAKKKSSLFTGVSWSNSHKKWVAYINNRPDTGKDFILGYFDIEEEAAEIRDLAVIYFKIKSKLNFPDKVSEYLKIDVEKIIKKIEINRKQSSIHKGVSKNNGKWQSHYYDNDNKKRIHIGTFSSEEEAYLARCSYLNKINAKTS